jgi:DNA invertase Pin-like site-specific DNA recombinase
MADLGYIRISTQLQEPGLQRTALAGCERVFEDLGVSGSLASRPALDALIDFARSGDTVVVYKLDRLGRSVRHTLSLIATLSEKGVGFRSVTEQISTAGPMGRAMLTVMLAFSELEKDTIRERTLAGLAFARSEGRLGGRPRALTEVKVGFARQLRATGHTVNEIAAELGVSRATVYRALEPQSVIERGT